ncbi:pilin [Patescibacteria group bacterium]|nr:pilin [Patescibacteria group bacterium]
MILPEQKLILIIGVVALISVFFTGKNIPVVYAAEGEIFYHERGYFKANNGVFGGPGCGVCLRESRKDKDSPWYCSSKRPGIKGYFTKDSACKKAYGSDVIAGTGSGGYVPVNMMSTCGLSSGWFQGIECIIPRSPACAELVNGVCQKIDTSLLQGGAKDMGKMPTNSGEFIVKIFIIILSFAGGIALLLIISAGYKIIMSKGKPEAIQQGREQLISAIVGLVFIIFSFVIFQLVFVDILKIPGII